MPYDLYEAGLPVLLRTNLGGVHQERSVGTAVFLRSGRSLKAFAFYLQAVKAAPAPLIGAPGRIQASN